MELLPFLILAIVSFCAVIIGTMVGMAMLILPPTMIFLGVPPHIAIATSRFSLLGNGIGNMARFSKRTKIEKKYIMPFVITGIAGSVLGAILLKKIPEEWLMNILGTLMIMISGVVFLEDKIKKSNQPKEITFKSYVFASIAGFFIGSYLGVMGGGAATLIIFLLVLIYGLDFQRALAHQKFIMFPIAVITSIVFVMQGMIDYSLAIPLLFVNILGGWVGAQLILKTNSVWLKRIIVPVTAVIGVVLILR